MGGLCREVKDYIWGSDGNERVVSIRGEGKRNLQLKTKKDAYCETQEEKTQWT